MRVKIVWLMASFAGAVLVGCERNNSGGADTPAERELNEMQQPDEEAKDFIGDAAEEVEEGVEEAVQEGRELMQEYLDRLRAMTDSVAGLEGGIGALANAPAVKDQVNEVRASLEEFGTLDADVLADLKEQFAPQIKAANAAVRAQIERIAEIPQLSGIKAMLEELNLIEVQEGDG